MFGYVMMLLGHHFVLCCLFLYVVWLMYRFWFCELKLRSVQRAVYSRYLQWVPRT